jgi:hypothetical protein
VNRVAPIVGLASHLGRGVQRIATDAIVGRVRSLPRTVDDLDAAYLSQIMGRTVTSVAVIGGDAGTTSRARLALTGDGVPETVFVKMPGETVATRLMGELGRLAETETRFYSQLAHELTGVPKSHGSAFDPLTGRFVLVLEDLAVDACEFPDTLHPLDKDHARRIVELLARVHATFWGRVPRWAYSMSADTASLLDWQFVRRGHPSRELAYTLVTSMTTADRQASERELLDAYRLALASAGGPELDRDELWDRYRQGALYAYVAALITAGMGGMQAESIALEGLRRGVAALDDLDTVSLLEKSL